MTFRVKFVLVNEINKRLRDGSAAKDHAQGGDLRGASVEEMRDAYCIPIDRPRAAPAAA